MCATKPAATVREATHYRQALLYMRESRGEKDQVFFLPKLKLSESIGQKPCCEQKKKAAFMASVFT